HGFFGRRKYRPTRPLCSRHQPNLSVSHLYSDAPTSVPSAIEARAATMLIRPSRYPIRGPRCPLQSDATEGGRHLMAWTDPTLWGWIFFLSEWAIRLAMLVVVPFRRTPAAAKGWLLLILFEPWVGLLLYLLIGRATLPRWQREQLAKLPRAMAGVVGRLAHQPNVLHPEVRPALSRAVALAGNLGGVPVLGGNSAGPLLDYD